MSRIHDIPGGYTTAKGRHRERKMLTMTPQERQKLYQYVCDLQHLRDCLEIEDWNDHDAQVLPGIAENIGPIHRGGRNRDMTTQQLEKLLKALIKIKAVCRRMGQSLPWCGVLNPSNIDSDGDIKQLTAREVKQQMDDNRNSDAHQEYLRQNPDLIEDRLEPLKSVWPNWKTSKKR